LLKKKNFFFVCVRSVTVAQKFSVRKFAALGVDQKFLFAADDGGAVSDVANAGDQVCMSAASKACQQLLYRCLM